MMKVCLVNPPSFDGPSSGYVSLPYALLVLGAILRKRGYEVQIIDLNLMVERGELDVRKSSFFREAAIKIVKGTPSVVGFTALCHSYARALCVAKECKKLNSSIPVIFGGPHAMHVAEDTLKHFPFIDVVARGEGEETIVELLEAISKGKSFRGISGISYRIGSRIRKNRDRDLIPSLDVLPLPAYDLVDFEKYQPRRSRERIAQIEGMRGCPYKCIFCSTSVFWRRKTRFKSPDKMVDEIISLKNNLRINTVYILDDLFTANKQVLNRFCELLKKKKVVFTWTCSSRVDCLTKAMLAKMSSAGCGGVFIGVESGSKRTLEVIGKRGKPESIIPLVKELTRLKMWSSVSFMIGFPHETMEDVEATVSLALRCKMSGAGKTVIRLLYPLPGTPLYSRYRRRIGFYGLSPFEAGDDYRNKTVVEKRLIKNYPSLFGYFYNLKPKYLSLKTLYGISQAFTPAVDMFPEQITKIMESRKLRAIDVFELWNTWVKKRSGRQAYQLTWPEWYARCKYWLNKGDI